MLLFYRRSTFTTAKRFIDPKVIYSEQMAKFSLLDVENVFKKYNGAPKIDKFSQRPDFFPKKDTIDPNKERNINMMM